MGREIGPEQSIFARQVEFFKSKKSWEISPPGVIIKGGDGSWAVMEDGIISLKKKYSRNDSSWRNLEPQSDFDIGVSEFVKKPRGPLEPPVWQNPRLSMT